MQCGLKFMQNAAVCENLIITRKTAQTQVSGCINIGDSYYGQLRHIDGDLSVDLPDLERPNPDFDDGNASQYHSASQMSTTGRRGAIASTPTLAVLLTDGVSTIKAVELGVPRRPVGSIDLKTKFAPGRKVRLRGPLNIRKGVLILPCGSLSAQNVPESQFYILGGEVRDYLVYIKDESQNFMIRC
ncbi:unnamed protein product [Dibothriocephalus latus]|uniref:RecQ mediated genome instability protein 1 OB-fold domain-containing protein n=1 Tax=Dibothriocephalus latus TaxID=60516 RepID=A0A3P7P431_DIBLA|nr:unnamed protein product [Dibothriocephalus latus]